MAKVLLVEDDINLREIYAARLSAEGYELVTASDGEEALSKAVSEKPSLIVLDVMMPKISGFDVLDILRSTPETEATKVIMLSALSQQSDRERGEKLGANKYLIKSQITLEDVVETVKGMLSDGDTGSPPIVTTSGGRLPSDGGQDDSTQDDAAQQNEPEDSADKTEEKADATKSSTAQEIAHIDSQMQGQSETEAR